MIKRGVVALVLLCGVSLGALGYCQDAGQQEELRSVTGEVADIDWVAGKIVLRTTDFGKVDELTFIVSNDTKITQGTSTIGFADINLSGRVTVEYVSNSLSGLKAIRITVGN